MHVKSNKRLYLILAVVSAAVAAMATFLLSRLMSPYQLEVLQQESLTTKYSPSYIIYHDFDKDGVSESVRAINDSFRDVYYLRVSNFAGGVIDQCNYSEPTHYYEWGARQLIFADYDEDGFDEILAFTNKSDSLFLYIHDLHRKRAILSRHFLLKTKPPNPDQLHFMIRPGGLTDIENQSQRGLVFAVCSGLQSRGVYIFDIDERKIVKRFQAEAFPGDLLLYDLTGDGKKEIILTGWATGNVHYPARYTDQKNWLFVFDQNLSPIFEPLSFGEYSSGLSCSPIEIDKERFLLLTYNYGGEKNLRDFICLISSDRKLSPKLYLTEGRVTAPIINYRVDPPVLYAVANQADLIKMNDQLKITATRSVQVHESNSLETNTLSHLVDLNCDGNLEFICGSEKNIQIIDEELRLLASAPISSRSGKITFRENGKTKPIEIGLHSVEDFYRFAFKKNPLFSYLPLLGFGFAGFSFLLLAGGYKFSALVYTYLSFFRFSLLKSANGVLILNSTGQISFLNHRVQTLLDLKNPIFKGQHFTKAFDEKPEIIALIQQSMNNKQPVEEKISIIRTNYQFEGGISVTPFISHFKLLSAYLITIHDYTEPITSERLQMWSKTAQKLAHDIKTPLSSVALNLKALQIRMQGISFGGDQEQIKDDINMMHEELQRVHQITKSFLKFSDLEKPSFQIIGMGETVQSAIHKFNNLGNEGLQIESEFDAQVDRVWADPQQIEMVLHILIENAIDALKGKGLIHISTSLAQYLDRPFQKFLEVEVSDNGPGMDQATIEKIFEPHFTSKAHGTGMGLSIARKIVEDHGGEIGVHSKPSVGTVMCFSVPIYENDSDSRSTGQGKTEIG